jgi:hypothetical protein
MHIYEVRVMIEATEELFADTFVGIALDAYIQRGKNKEQLDAQAVQSWEADTVSHKEQEEQKR